MSEKNLSSQSIDFEEAMEELRAILIRLDEGEIPLAEMVNHCNRAKLLERSLRNYLDKCQLQLESLDTEELSQDLLEISSGSERKINPIKEDFSNSADDGLPF